jgi:hypothetical protein
MGIKISKGDVVETVEGNQGRRRPDGLIELIIVTATKSRIAPTRA